MRKSTARILVVDDERFFREAIADVLGELKLPMSFAATGAEALEQAGIADVGVVLLDIELPDRNGLEVFRDLRGLRPELKVIVW